MSTQPMVVIERSTRLFHLDLRSVWQHRELLYFLVWREVKVRYKQTALGAAWVLFQPLMTMAVFTIVFGKLARIPSDGLPYPVFAYTALLPWMYFSQAVARSGTGLVSNAGLVTKVYFPRLIIPIAAALSPGLDFAVSFTLLLGMMLWFGIAPTWGILLLPLFLLLAMLTALTAGLWLSPLNVRFRDVGYTIPFLTQLWMFASPVAYPVTMIPQQWRFVYGLNPMAGIIEGFRWALLGSKTAELEVIAVSTTIMLALLCGGIVFFQRMERTFADVI